jgi:putative transposase
MWTSVPCLVTWRVVDGRESLRRQDVVRAIEEAFRRGCKRGDFRLAVYSIQRDHLHLIVEANDRDALGRGMMALAARIERRSGLRRS